MSDLIQTCGECRGKFNGRNITHTHTSGEIIDDRFLDCRTCHGQGAITCENCGGTGRVVMRDGVKIGTHSRPATLNMLGPRRKL